MNKFEIENLELYYGDFKALKNINMNISPNEITAFIGPSGCGKSTLLKTLDRMNDLVDTCKINGALNMTARIFILTILMSFAKMLQWFSKNRTRLQ